MIRLLPLLVAATVPTTGLEGDAGPGLTFERDIRPILKAHCLHCHGEGEEPEGGLDVRLRRLLVEGGDSGSAIEPGLPEESELLYRMAEGEMPPGEVAIRPSAAEIETIRRWIAAGAPTARDEPDDPDELPKITPEDRAFWSFRPIGRPAIPTVGRPGKVANPIDAFLLDRLEPLGLAFNPGADRATLIRRATFDLTGLPPTPEEVEAFVGDDRPDAYGRLVDRLLASPRYGERWGRHWLDVAGYADSEGYNDEDTPREDAWRYRDYVIRSLNEEKPVDRFILEQLAGDELAGNRGGDLTPGQVEVLTATGFLRMVPDGTGSHNDDPVMAQNAVIAATINQVSTAFLGLTVGCAECHDHRYDPILHTDYYRLRAVFEPAFNPGDWREPRRRRISLLTAAGRERAEALEAEARAVEAETQAILIAFRDEVFEKEIARLPEAIRGAAREAGLQWQRDPKGLSPEQAKLLDDYPTARVAANQGILDLFLEKEGRAKELKDAVEAVSKRAEAIRARKPPEAFVRALFEVPGQVPSTHVFLRGNPTTPGEEVGPGDLTVLASDQPADFPADDADSLFTGRRLALARRLTDGSHPLTARVLVNRVWMHHFGRGIVATPGDFGTQGERPTHPELLDWLASELMDGGWRLKPIHRLILTSRAYRQSSELREDGQAVDADNTLLWRMPVRRLEAEAVRDAILAVSGAIEPEMGGPPAPTSTDANNQVIVDSGRRSVYVEVRRTAPAHALEVFDGPALDPVCVARSSSTVAPQALLLLNSSFVLDQADRFADRVEREAGSADPEARARVAWRLAFGVDPDAETAAGLVGYLGQQEQMLTARSVEGASRKALASLCQVLLGSNRFLYVD